MMIATEMIQQSQRYCSVPFRFAAGYESEKWMKELRFLCKQSALANGFTFDIERALFKI
jgi:hypothetical protein